jgi:hypothetical protein
VRRQKKGEKERKDKGKEKKSYKMTEQEQCFIKLWETWKKMQAIGDHNIIFFPLSPNIILIVKLKRAQKPTGGKYMIFFPLCLYFFPLGHAIISTFTDGVLGENMARGKSNHIFPAGHILFFVTVSGYFNWGKIYDIFSPCVFIFPPVSSFFPPVSLFFPS